MENKQWKGGPENLYVSKVPHQDPKNFKCVVCVQPATMVCEICHKAAFCTNKHRKDFAYSHVASCKRSRLRNSLTNGGFVKCAPGIGIIVEHEESKEESKELPQPHKNSNKK